MPRVMVLGGTKKAGFVYLSDAKRQKWEISEPILPGWSFFHMSADTRDSKPRMYAAANHWAWGPSVAKSEDLGKTWDYNSTGLAFPPEMKEYKENRSAPPGVPGDWDNTPAGGIGNIWNVQAGHESEPGVVFAGVQPAGAFRRENRGPAGGPVQGVKQPPHPHDWGGNGGGAPGIPT